MATEKESGPDRDSGPAPVITRRQAVKWGALGSVGLAAAGSACVPSPGKPLSSDTLKGGLAPGHGSHNDMIAVGELRRGSFDPSAFLTHFDYGRVSKLPSGQTLREYEMEATEFELEVAPGVFFPAWGYNGQVPGPTIRCTEGDRLRVHFKNS